MSLRHVQASGLRLEYEWHGPGPEAAPTLVFLHEGLGSVSMWRGFPARLAEATGLGALVYSRGGHGGSDPVPLPRPLRYMHDEALRVLPEVLAALAVRDTILVGHSDGGSIALIHAGSVEARREDRGGRERALEASNHGGRGGSALEASGRVDRHDARVRIRALVLEAPHVFAEELGLRSIAAAADRYRQGDLRHGLERHHTNVDVAFWGWNRAWLDPTFREWNIEEYLPGVRVPVLVIQGEDDEYGTLRQLDAIEAGCRGPVERLVLPKCGHSPHRDQPERTLDAMATFVRRVLGRS